jgi:hypothetical protein
MKTANERRAEAQRMHHQNPAAVAALKVKVSTMTLAGAEAKEIAGAIDRSLKHVYRWLVALGFRRMYVTAEERAMIMAARANAQRQ